MTDNKIMEWLKGKELCIKTKSANSKCTYGVTLGTGDLPYINRLKHILGVRIGTRIEPSYDTGYKDGLEKAWEIAKKIVLDEARGGYTGAECVEIFGAYSSDAILTNNTVFRALVKVEAYEKQKAEKDKIKDGDEVSLDDGTKGVVVCSGSDGHLNVVNAFGGMRSYNVTEVIKTGRYFPQMVEMMKEMRDNDGTF